MKILLAEDERDYSRALVKLLRHRNYAVDAVYDGREALDYGLAGRYDGIILDIMMPRIDGIEVLRALRQKGVSTPVLMLTAKAGVDDRILGYDAGADDYLQKPFITSELLARVRALLRRSGVFAPDILTFGNVSLNCASCELRGPDGAYRLTGKEYQVAEMLFRNPRIMISAERFMESIWGWEAGAGIHVVWANISFLRKKLAGIGADAEIRAARGLGYYLAAREG